MLMTVKSSSIEQWERKIRELVTNVENGKQTQSILRESYLRDDNYTGVLDISPLIKMHYSMDLVDRQKAKLLFSVIARSRKPIKLRVDLKSFKVTDGTIERHLDGLINQNFNRSDDEVIALNFGFETIDKKNVKSWHWNITTKDITSSTNVSRPEDTTSFIKVDNDVINVSIISDMGLNFLTHRGNSIWCLGKSIQYDLRMKKFEVKSNDMVTLNKEDSIRLAKYMTQEIFFDTVVMEEAKENPLLYLQNEEEFNIELDTQDDDKEIKGKDPDNHELEEEDDTFDIDFESYGDLINEILDEQDAMKYPDDISVDRKSLVSDTTVVRDISSAVIVQKSRAGLEIRTPYMLPDLRCDRTFAKSTIGCIISHVENSDLESFEKDIILSGIATYVSRDNSLKLIFEERIYN
jgi:hypothetical protein